MDDCTVAYVVNPRGLTDDEAQDWCNAIEEEMLKEFPTCTVRCNVQVMGEETGAWAEGDNEDAIDKINNIADDIMWKYERTGEWKR